MRQRVLAMPMILLAHIADAAAAARYADAVTQNCCYALRAIHAYMIAQLTLICCHDAAADAILSGEDVVYMPRYALFSLLLPPLPPCRSLRCCRRRCYVVVASDVATDIYATDTPTCRDRLMSSRHTWRAYATPKKRLCAMLR